MKAEGFKNAIIKGLRDQGLKLTPQRLEVIELLTRDDSHPSALAIYRQARLKYPRISLSTVYYTLTLFKKHGLIRELEFEGKDNRYDRDTGDHLNLICTKCGKIEDFLGATPVPPAFVEQHTGFKALKVRFEYYGVCKECNQ